MIWAKTEAGRREIQSRERVQARAQRTLLLLIDGVKTDATLLASVAGVSPADIEALQAMGLIAPVSAPLAGGPPLGVPASSVAGAPLARGAAAMDGTRPGGTPGTPISPNGTTAQGSAAPRGDTADAPLAPNAADAQRALTAALTQLIPTHLGVRGFTLTLAVERAGSLDELRTVAERAIEAIARRRGDAVAAEARRTLFGR